MTRKTNSVVRWIEEGIWHELPFNTKYEQLAAERFIWTCVPGGWAEILVNGEHAGLLTTEER